MTGDLPQLKNSLTNLNQFTTPIYERLHTFVIVYLTLYTFVSVHFFWELNAILSLFYPLERIYLKCN